MSQKATTYDTGVRFNHQLGILETLSFVGEGVGAALYVAATLTGQPAMAALGIVFVVAAVLALRAHLGKPERSWRAVRRLATSWVSRGVLMMSGFLGFATLALAAAYIGVLAPLQKPLTVIALVFAAVVIVYAGMLLRSMRAIRFWRGPFVPLSFAAHSLATALVIAWAMVQWLAADLARLEWLLPVGAGALILCAALSAIHLLRVERSAGVKASIERLFAGDLRKDFLWGSGVLGIVVPLAGLIAFRSVTASLGHDATGTLFVLIAICRLYGDFAYRNAVVVAGAYEPIFPAAPIRSLSSCHA